MNTKHTPGPWSVDTNSPYSQAQPMVCDSYGYGLALISVQANDKTSMVDARLIAAAPELADALRAVAEFWAGGDAPDELTEQINAALAKAGLYKKYPYEIDGVPACRCGDPFCTDYKDMS